jgi:hypothetical protein
MKQLPQVLLVGDNPADVGLAREALAGGRHQSEISDVPDGGTPQLTVAGLDLGSAFLLPKKL